MFVRNLPQRRHVLGSVVLADPAPVFAKGHVQAPVRTPDVLQVMGHSPEAELRRSLEQVR